MIPLRHFQIIVKTFPYYKTSPYVLDPNSRDPSSVYIATNIKIYTKVDDKQNKYGKPRENIVFIPW